MRKPADLRGEAALSTGWCSREHRPSLYEGHIYKVWLRALSKDPGRDIVFTLDLLGSSPVAREGELVVVLGREAGADGAALGLV